MVALCPLQGTLGALLSDECEATLGGSSCASDLHSVGRAQSFSLGLRSQAGAALSVGDRATCRDIYSCGLPSCVVVYVESSRGRCSVPSIFEVKGAE